MEKPQYVAMLREDDMMVVVLKALTGKSPPKGMSTKDALAGWPDDVLDVAHRVVRDLMEYLRERMVEGGAPPETVLRIRDEGRLQ